MLEKTIPPRYRKIVLLDCDVFFVSPTWYIQANFIVYLTNLNLLNHAEPLSHIPYVEATHKFKL